MSDRDLDRRCSEILGKPNVWTEPLLPYSTDLNASRELLEWAFNMSKNQWMIMLDLIGNSVGVSEFADLYAAISKCMLATPRQICEAFCETFGGPDDRP